MTDFFISYTQADRAWAEWIAWVLEAAQKTTKIQAWDFGAGKNFVIEMDTAAKEAERTLLVLSPDYLGSRFAKAEWTAAFAKDPTGEKGTILPVRVREVELDGLLGQIVYIDLVGLDEAAARERLLAGLARGRTKPVEPPDFPGGPRPRYPLDLAAFPAGEIPARGPLPAGSRMPFAANPLFVGREEDLRTLARRLRAGDTSAVGEVEIAAASGLGGIGKTQLASEFVHRYGRYFEGGVFWMSFADPAAVPSEVASCGRSLDLHPSYDSLAIDEQTRLVEEAWTGSIPRLLIFDNCEDEALLRRWRPRFGGARVLVTSRRARWDRALGIKAVALPTLPRERSVELLRRFRPDADDVVLSRIAAELGDLPLALHLAGSFLDRFSQAFFGQPTAYLESLQKGGLLEHPSLQGKFSEALPTEHEVHVGRTFALSIERLNSEDGADALALALLARAAFFAPGEAIPRDLLLKTMALEDDEKVSFQVEDALGRLVALGLLESGAAGALVMHRLVAEFARDSGEEVRNAVEKGLLAEAKRLNKAGIPGPLLAWQPHLRAITESAQSREDTIAAVLCNMLGYHLRMIGDYPGARPYYERALAIWEKVLGAEHRDTTTSLNNLGVLLQSQGDLAGARPYYERALEIWERVLGVEHPDTATSLNNLGGLLDSQGDFAGARPYYERALEIREKVLGAEHPNTATSLNNLGGLLQSRGDFAGTRLYYERALEIREKVLGAEHPDTAQSLNNIGFLLQSQGDLAGAHLYLERALTIHEKVLGAEHPDTATSLNNLGGLLDSQGDFAGARLYYEWALSIREKVLGAEHPDTALSLNNLGGLLQSRGDFAAARPYLERALSIREKVLGAEHPDTAQSLNNLGFLLQSQGDLAGARPYLERALAINEKVLSAEHPDTATSLNNLGFLLDSQGDFAGARPYYERALEIREKVLGAEHPDTAVSLNNLGGLLCSQRDLAGARPYYERALAILETRLGPDHPDTKIVRGNLTALDDPAGV
jgi:tetratricopeptide (TPR) repeat protein